MPLPGGLVSIRGDVAERIARANELGGNRLKASLLLRRWACVLRANDPDLANGLMAAHKRLLQRELRTSSLAAGKGRIGHASWRLRRAMGHIDSD